MPPPVDDSGSTYKRGRQARRPRFAQGTIASQSAVPLHGYYRVQRCLGPTDVHLINVGDRITKHHVDRLQPAPPQARPISLTPSVSVLYHICPRVQRIISVRECSGLPSVVLSEQTSKTILNLKPTTNNH
ncbi:hypothetical protein ILUMI_05368 [Ignelater luminosus]|uniref:Uncharacterized protein n=1 Tax=Ignelater luminosus TaxID=2038154 RepID=A0A8K0DAN5_IGNLU|nr:hypothetical protein ILUMI_05368 [Ignelater luminosus]